MTDFETILISLLIPIAYVMVYIAGRYDLLGNTFRMLQSWLDKLDEFDRED